LIPDITANPFKVGSTEGDVLKVMGVPDTIQIDPPALGSMHKDYSVWCYGNSRIDFSKEGKVLMWSNNDGNLRAE